ncbi:MAG: protein phosphatase 2C domain-containing protein [Pseudomonadales bacterium]|nr:protein phosphatase 2C domain-containing protein [Pseudomonadales bacterium]
MGIKWSCASESHVGIRRTVNEDSVLVRSDIGLWAVADGMGGHSSGDLASSSITEALSEVRSAESLTGLLDAVDDIIVDVNRSLRAHSRLHNEGQTIGSTIVTLLANDKVGVSLWAGDSRLYRLRNQKLEQITRDHNPIADLLDEGLISEHTALSKDTNVITRAVGGQENLVLDVAVFDVEPGDTFLLCSDGLYREINFDEISEMMSGQNIHRCSQDMLRVCLERGARDNVSLILSRACELH